MALPKINKQLNNQPEWVSVSRTPSQVLGYDLEALGGTSLNSQSVGKGYMYMGDDPDMSTVPAEYLNFGNQRQQPGAGGRNPGDLSGTGKYEMLKGGLDILNTGANIYGAYNSGKAVGVARDNLRQQREQFNLNFDQASNAYNAQIFDSRRQTLLNNGYSEAEANQLAGEYVGQIGSNSGNPAQHYQELSQRPVPVVPSAQPKPEEKNLNQ